MYIHSHEYVKCIRVCLCVCVHKNSKKMRGNLFLFFLKVKIFQMGLSSQHSLSQVPPTPTQATTNHSSLCSSYWVVLRWTQEWLTWACTRAPTKRPKNQNTQWAASDWNRATIPLAPKTTPKEWSWHYWGTSHSMQSAPHSSLSSVVMLSTHSQSVCGLVPSTTCQKKPRLNYHRRTHITHTRDTPRTPGSGEQWYWATGPHRHLLH